MYFLINHEKKIIFGWSAKCACSFIKRYFYQLNDINDEELVDIHYGSHGILNFDHSNYKIIIFIRNPYKRLVSAFIDKYAKKKYTINIKNLTFEKFINEMDKNGLKYIEKHHFPPQFSEAFRGNINLHRIYDINNIDYNYINSLFNKDLDVSKISRADNNDNHRTKYNYKDNIKAYNITIDELNKMEEKPHYKCFYNKDIKSKVDKFYNIDLINFQKIYQMTRIENFNYNFNTIFE